MVLPRLIVKILLPLLLLLAEASASGHSNVTVTSLTANDGLSNNTVWAVLQDRAGFIWMGTADGLNRYDGREIRHYTPDRIVGENNNVLSLCEDESGNIWVGTYSGLCVYNPKTDRETVFPLNIPDVLDAELRVYQIIKTSDGNMWIPAMKYGFIRINPETLEVKRIAGSADGSVTYYGSALCFNGTDSFYVVMNDGNIYSSSDELCSINPLFDSRVLGFQPRNLIYAFGYLFTGSAEQNIKIDIRTRQVSGTPWSAIRVPAPAPNDELWVANQSGLHILDVNLQEKINITMDMGSRLAFQGKSIMCACRDRDGNMWVGTYYSGVFHLIHNRANLQKYYPRFIDDSEPSHVREILPDKDGSVWIATEDKGLLHFSLDEGSFMPVKLPISALNIQALCGSGDYLWIGAYAQNNALVKMDKRDGTFTLFKDSPQRIYSICGRRDGSMAIGGSEGLFILNEGEFRRSEKIDGVVQEVMEDSHGRLWVSTGRDGLWCCLGNQEDGNGRWVHYVHNAEDDKSIPSNKVTSVFEDRSSRIWVTTESGGFCLLNPVNGHFTRFAYMSQTDYKVCYKISEDANGILWITTSKGLLCFNPDTKSATLLTRKDGMLSNQYNYSSNVISSDGILYAGSGDGLISFEPEKVFQWPRNSTIMLTDFQVVESKVRGKAGFSLPESINKIKSVVLQYQYNSFRIKVSTDNYGTPVINHLVYKIDGVNNEWTDTSDGIIEVNKLKPGKYTLQICVKRINGDLEPGRRSLDITIRPPLMASAPAIIAYFLIIVALMVLAIGMSAHKMKKQHDRDLLNNQMEFVTAMAHEIKTPLSLVQGSMELAKDAIPAGEGGPLLKNLDVAFRNLDRIRELISQLQDYSSAQVNSHTPQLSNVCLEEEIKSISMRFSVEASAKGIQFTLDLPESKVKIWTVRDAVDKILTNLFSNAIKYAYSFVRISLSYDEDKCRLVVINDGMVIPKEMANRIFEPFVRYPENSANLPGMGIGLSTSRKLARMIGGNIVYRQTERGQNSFTFELPSKDMKIGAQEELPSVEANNELQDLSGKKVILVVEDTPEMKDFITEQLSADYKVLEASDGTKALNVLESGINISLILSDVMMPNMDGFELCRRVKDNILTSHIPVILLTARTDTGSKIEGLGKGADMYLEKPFSLEHLKAAIRSVFDNREQLRKHYLAYPLEQNAIPAGNSVDSDFLKRLVTYVENNIENESLRISDLAEASYVSESNLYRKTKALLGMSPLEYVHNIRLKVAESLLRDSDIPISEIVMRTGFRSHPYFSACFKKQYGKTPGQYRRENR